MNRLVVVTARSMASAAPKITTGIEHAEKAKQRVGGKPEWSLYKCDDYLKFDKYSYAHAEITMNKDRVPQPTNRKADELPKMSAILTVSNIPEIFESPKSIESFFSNWVKVHKDNFKLTLDKNILEALGPKMTENVENSELTALLIEAVRILARVPDIEYLLTPELCEQIAKFAGLTNSADFEIPEKTRMEAAKCLINTLYQTKKMQNCYYAHPENVGLLLSYLIDLEPSKRENSKIDWIRNISPENLTDIWFFYQKIAFVATARSRDYQMQLSRHPLTVEALLGPMTIILKKNAPSVSDLKMAEEALKTFYNAYCHFNGDVPSLDEANASRATRVFRDILLSPKFSFQDGVCTAAINALSVPPLPTVLGVLCVDPEASFENSSDEHTSMVFTEALLKNTEERLDAAFAEKCPKLSLELIDLIGPNFQLLSQLSVESKHVRRYCRLRIFPPLTADEVQKRPEENDTLRGKIVRTMTVASSTKEVVGAFIFIICKRSVNRMIKYVGFGHSAGHLANFGLLGQLNQPRRASDSEDSETEDYNNVKDSVNPVTGAVYPADRGSVLDGMSNEQKEFEAMKLVEAIDRMMDAGIVKPGTIGEDGKVREVSHVLELIKNAPSEEHDDSDSD